MFTNSLTISTFPSFVRRGEGEVEGLPRRRNLSGLLLLGLSCLKASTPPSLPLQRGGTENRRPTQGLHLFSGILLTNY